MFEKEHQVMKKLKTTKLGEEWDKFKAKICFLRQSSKKYI